MPQRPPPDILEALIKALPATLLASNGNAIAINFIDETLRTPPLPHGTIVPGASSRTPIGLIKLSRTRPTDFRQSYARHEEPTTLFTETLAYTTGTSLYGLANRPPSTDVTPTLTATVAAVPNTPLVYGIDFDFVEGPPSTPGGVVLAPTHLRFIGGIGGTTPDDATNFSLTYAVKFFEDIRRDYRTVDVIITLLVNDLKGTALVPDRGATETILATRLCPALADSLGSVLTGLRGRPLVLTTGPNIFIESNNIIAHATSASSPSGQSEGPMRATLLVELRQARDSVIRSTTQITETEAPAATP